MDDKTKIGSNTTGPMQGRGMRMRILWAVVLLVVALIAIYFGYSRYAQPPQATTTVNSTVLVNATTTVPATIPPLQVPSSVFNNTNTSSMPPTTPS